MTDKGEDKKNRGLHKRSLTSFITTFSFALVAFSGIMLFIVPPGRIASWTEWRFLGLLKEEWGSIHIVLSLLFMAIGIYHLILNWRAFTGYLVARVKGGLHYPRELIISVVVVAFFTGGAYLNIFPFDQFMAFNRWVKASWVTSPEFEPPIAHAEDLSLAKFAARLGMNLDEALAELKKEQVVVEDANNTLALIGARNSLSPMEIYMKIKKFEKSLPKATVFTEDLVVERFEGRGIGAKTLAQVARENNLDLEGMTKRLVARGVVPRDNETIRQLADRQPVKTTPIQIMQMSLVEKPSGYEEKRKEIQTGPGAKGIPPADRPSPQAAKPETPAAAGGSKPAYTEETVRARFEGKGIGARTLADLAREHNLDLNYLTRRMAEKGLSQKEGETLKEMADRYKTTPIELMKMILVE